MAQDLGRNKTIQTIRDMDRRNPYILICRDQKYHISVMKTREPLKIVKIGDKYVFSF
jgi:predicted nuclease of predicted toxin-antitoxin system